MTYEEFLKKNTDLRHYIREQEKVNKAKEPKKFIKIEKVSFEKGLCLLSNGEKKKIEDIVKIVLVGQDCVSNPSILALWSGFKTISANVPKKEVKKEDLSKESFDDLKDLITDSDELEKSLLQGNTKSNAYLDMYSKVEKIIKNRNEVLSKSVERLKEIEDYFEKNIAPRLEKFESYAEKFNFYPNESVVRHEEYWEDYINFVYKTLGIKKEDKNSIGGYTDFIWFCEKRDGGYLFLSRDNNKEDLSNWYIEDRKLCIDNRLFGVNTLYDVITYFGKVSPEIFLKDKTFDELTALYKEYKELSERANKQIAINKNDILIYNVIELFKDVDLRNFFTPYYCLEKYFINSIKEYVEKDKGCQEELKSFGGYIKKLTTGCGNPCYLSSKSETEHLIYIPLNVTELNDPEDWQETDFTSQIQKLEGSLKVIGGSGLQYCDYMFNGCDSLQSLDLSSFDTSKVKDMNNMFLRCYSLEFIDLSYFDTSKVKDMGYMFYDCASLQSLDLSSFDTSSVENMGDMFNDCGSLQSLDLSTFDTSNVENMEDMFYECASLQSLDLSSFDTSKVKDMGYMFDGCKSLQSLDLSSFDTSKVTDMGFMFSGCKNLQSLDLSSFDTSRVENMKDMFYDCGSLQSLDLSSFDISYVEVENMFYGCASLQSVKGNEDIQKAFADRE